MANEWIIPALAGAVSLAFAARVAGQWSERRRAHQLAWALGFATYALASFIEAFVASEGWSGPLYRLYFPLAAAPVGLLGLGTVYLLRPRRLVGPVLAGLVALGVVVCALAPLTLPLDDDTLVKTGVADGSGEAEKPLAEWGPDLGAKAVPFSNAGRWAFLVMNIAGGLLLIGGAFASWWRTRSHGVLLIGLGAMLPAAGGVLSSLVGIDDRLMLQFLGIVVMFAGYTRSREASSQPSKNQRRGAPE